MKVINFLWSLYIWIIGGSIFVISLIIMILWSYIFKAEKWDPWFKLLLRFMFKAALVNIKIEGKENIQKNKAYIFMPNHISLLDIPLMAAYIPVFIRGVEAHHHFSWPIYGWATKRYGNIPINRKNISKSLKSFGKAGNYLKENKSVIIFPEGHRTHDGKLQKFKKMPFLLAKQAGAEIIPVGISGMYQLHPYGSFLLNPFSKLKIKFGKPISIESIAKLSIEELAELTQNRVKELIERP